ncbi:putative PEP-CTERM system TPR-repeat lipoprotein [Ruegeria sp. THAF57]|uniref:tetratricopeptide repeat protein n=1 Tax=Ruegeria sp. THAF57 TaxID=2744555 RepID=UPI0015DFE131|nr:tetratricopeptide repeat protein [Ruegeria sp. THAF57]CAD0187013.1 putative PEP-CTERM system TPR-repeat lipoprotein [Ruegeria sp. THAF57]
MAASDGISEQDKRRALANVLDDTHFDGADRLRSFLTYVVEEEIAGRGADIRGKTVAQDVYDRDTTEGIDPENVVRVDARRLRQLLELYYEGVGKFDPVRLYIDTGGYRPRFEPATKRIQPDPRKSEKALWLPLAAFTAGAILGAVLAVSFLPVTSERGSGSKPDSVAVGKPDLLRNAAIYEKSPSALQAYNLAQQARVMTFPIFDLPRQILVLSVFERVIEMDGTYFGGYAGAAQTLATLSILIPELQAKADYATAAMDFADKAMQLAPEQGWSQSAKSWAYFANGDYEAALTLGRRASQLDPADGAILDFLGAVALFSGDFKEAVEIADRLSLLESSNQRFANRNISGAAHFHLGEFETTIARFEEAKELGDPLSAPSLAYVTASLAALGRESEARAKLAELELAWPEVPVDAMLKSIYRNDAHAAAVIDRLVALGWTGPSQETAASQ